MEQKPFVLSPEDIKLLEQTEPEKPVTPQKAAVAAPKAAPKQRRRRGKAPTSRLPVYQVGSELSVEECLLRFDSETNKEMTKLSTTCKEMSEKLNIERTRLRKKHESTRDDSPERRKQDQFIGSVKYKVDNIQRNLQRLQEDLKTRNKRLMIEYELQTSRIMVEREQRQKTSMNWCDPEALITTPYQRRLADAAAETSRNAKSVFSLKPKATTYAIFQNAPGVQKTARSVK